MGSGRKYERYYQETEYKLLHPADFGWFVTLSRLWCGGSQRIKHLRYYAIYRPSIGDTAIHTISQEVECS